MFHDTLHVMKRLGVYAFILTSATMLAGIMFQAQVYAATIPPQGTYDYFNGIISDLHTAANTALNDAATKDPSATSKKATEDIKKVAQKNYDAYTAAFNTEKAKSSASSVPADAQIKGIQAWIASMNDQNNLVITRAYAGSQKTAYDQYARKVQDAMTAAIQIKNNTIAAGSNEAAVQTDASTITNAAKGNTNTTAQVKDPAPVGKCSLVLPSNISACIDEGFTWLVKNTILQLAGFLVWLSANMLNFAIQTSVLDFAKWAPNSLYPIWIIIRQIVSLAVVFAGLYLGFMYIIGREDTLGKYMGWLVMFALFVNFSYPITRALVDISNIVSLNVYQAAVGSEPLSGESNSTAGGLIMSKLGLQGLVASATAVETKQAGFVNQINSTPAAVLAVVFVAYAAYVLFMATAIIAVRTAVLVFLIVASPILLLDAVIPKMGDVAVKMRKIFFEQLIVAPVFMIMFALTLKFMDVFQSTGGPLSGSGASASAINASGADSIKVFFGILMMLIMLHIMLKVTKSVAGAAGELATKTMGKVGGFGLGLASGGTGLLARGTIGAAASRMQNSAWMDKLQGSRTGRGLYSLTGSLAQSSFDSRNIGMVNRGMASAGMGMGKGSTQTYEKRYTEKEKSFNNKYESIKDDKARADYYDTTKNGVRSRIGRTLLGSSDGDKIATKMVDSERGIQSKRQAAIAAFTKAKPGERSALIDAAKGDYVLEKKLQETSKYLTVDDANDADAVNKKIDSLVALDDSDMAKKVIDNDQFKDIQKSFEEQIAKDEAALELINKDEKITLADANGNNVVVSKFENTRQKLAQKKADHKKLIEEKRAGLLKEYQNRMNGKASEQIDFDITGADFAQTITNRRQERSNAANGRMNGSDNATGGNPSATPEAAAARRQERQAEAVV